MEHNKHAEHLGGLLGNLQTLEIIIRLCLAQQPGSPARNKFMDEVCNAQVGAQIPESDMSNYASLKELIKKFNKVFSNNIDSSIVDLRDALAHGRVFQGPNDDFFRIVKFEKPVNGSARLSLNQVMNEEWFNESQERVRKAIFIASSQIDLSK